MKTILYLLIAVFIFGIIAAAIPNMGNSSKIIKIQSVENNISSSELKESANIISKRLKSFSSEKFEIQLITDKNQIQVSFSDKWDINFAAGLLTQKGRLEFYETYNREELQEILGSNDQLFDLLIQDISVGRIGCTDEQNIKKLSDYLETLSPKLNKCKFAFGLVSNSNGCLYALKKDSLRSCLMLGDDIEKVSNKKDNRSDNFEIELKFKESVVKKWTDATKRNLNRAIAIVFDGNVIYAPILKSEITSGLCMITGNFSEKEARYFVSIVQNGELPSSFKFVK